MFEVGTNGMETVSFSWTTVDIKYTKIKPKQTELYNFSVI